MKEIELKVEGMSCEGCENRIKKALQEIDKVEDIVASHTEKKVKLTLKEDSDIEMIKEIIESLGFEIMD